MADRPPSRPRGPTFGGVSRREVLQRVGAAGLVLGGAAALGRIRWDPGGIDVHRAEGTRQVRDFRLKAGSAIELPELVVAKNEPNAAILTRRAVDTLGGMKRFVSRGDIVVVK